MVQKSIIDVKKIELQTPLIVIRVILIEIPRMGLGAYSGKTSVLRVYFIIVFWYIWYPCMVLFLDFFVFEY